MTPDEMFKKHLKNIDDLIDKCDKILKGDNK